MKSHTVTISAAVFLLLTAVNPVHADGDSWQMATLFNPGPAQIRSEQKGRVMIYEGMKDTDVDRAMDEQFDRIETMMFTGTVVTDESGEPLRDSETGRVVVEEDGC